ncbi:MAG TPA: response regulator [Burkholderiaceae bacterium]|nr:response regulator [Burkholderiaceae bacterium]
MNSSIVQSDERQSTVYIVEDDADAREVLAALLKPSRFRVHCFSSAEEFLRHGAGARPACAVVDLRLPGMSGLELQAKLHADAPKLPVIVVTGHGDVATARAALLAGARDFLEKPVQPQELLDAVGAALESDTQAIERARERGQMAESVSRLTPREHEVFQRITDGLHNREIAVELGISPRTVEVHRARLMDKLNARRLADLFRLRIAMEPAE